MIGMDYSERITLGSLCRLLDCKPKDFPAEVGEEMDKLPLRYRKPVVAEVEEYVLQMLKFIENPLLRRDRDENLKVWEKGWEENLQAFRNNPQVSLLKPKYFRPSRFLRLDRKIIVPENSDIEYDLFCIVRKYIFHRFFRGYDSYYELGCGSCQNLAALFETYPDQPICGLDWTEASQGVVSHLNRSLSHTITGRLFDMTRPDDTLELGGNSLVFSIHALEQLGEDHRTLVDFLIGKRPAAVFHYEPILDFYDDSDLYDYLSNAYSRRRNYLTGFMGYLEECERRGEIEIIYKHRPCIGGVLHESSFVAWRPSSGMG